MTIRALFLIGCCLLGLAACSSLKPVAPALVWKEPALAPPGSYRLQLLLDGQGDLEAYLERQRAQDPTLAPFSVAGLRQLLKRAFAPLHLPIPAGSPFCHLQENFRHCRGIELQADIDLYADQSVVLRGRTLYHVRIRLEGDQPNFFRSAKSQRDRGEFALPRRYYVGSLVEAIQKKLPILQEIARDYRKYLKSDGQEVEIALTLEETKAGAEAARKSRDIEDGAHLSGGVLVSLLPNLSLVAGMTLSALHTGGRTFWEVLKEQQEFDFSKAELDLRAVEFSHWKSLQGYVSRTLRQDEPSDVVIHGITIRLRPQASPAPETAGPTRPF